ncbi:MAG TPA: 50S ribosomal protein L11 methyltransferase [Thermoanaerobaculia bacterium]|nr:50S ribosomal protein L11 methyltransferase [Thermoanaerobaculia bacterium]
MDWETRYFVSRQLRLRVQTPGLLVATTTRSPSEIKPEAIPVLLGFSAAATPREVLERLRQEWEIDEESFVLVVDSMLAQGILVPAGGIADPLLSPALRGNGFGSAVPHLRMLRDAVRVMSYRSAIERQAPGRTVVEIGCGSGILSIFAAKAGARKVIAIEETRIAEVAAEMFAASGCADRIELRVANSRDVELDEPADLIIHEILGVDPFEESILPVLADARRRLLRPGGRLLPYRLEVCGLGVEAVATVTDADRLRSETEELRHLYGLDFQPLLRALEESARNPASRRTVIAGKPHFEPKILSEECRFLDIDLRDDDIDLPGKSFRMPLKIVHEGVLGGIAVFFRAHLDEQVQLTTSPHAPPTHWGWTIQNLNRRVPVSPGDQVEIALELKDETGTQLVSLDLA